MGLLESVVNLRLGRGQPGKDLAELWFVRAMTEYQNLRRVYPFACQKIVELHRIPLSVRSWGLHRLQYTEPWFFSFINWFYSFIVLPACLSRFVIPDDHRSTNSGGACAIGMVAAAVGSEGDHFRNGTSETRNQPGRHSDKYPHQGAQSAGRGWHRVCESRGWQDWGSLVDQRKVARCQSQRRRLS